MSDRELGTVADSHKSGVRKRAWVHKITSSGCHVGAGAGVEEPLAGAGRSGGDAGGAESGVECLHVPGLSTRFRSRRRELERGHRGRRGLMVHRHGLLLGKGRSGAQNAGSRCTEGHRPCLDEARPWVVPGRPRRRRGRRAWRLLLLRVAGVATAAGRLLVPGLGFVLLARSRARSARGGRRLTGRAMAIMSGEESVTGLQLVVMRHLQFFKREERPRALEGVRRPLGGDDRLDVTVLGVEAAQKVQNLTGLGDGLADVAQLVGDPLEGGAVLVDRRVTLDGGAELGLKVDGAVQVVVEEEPLDVAPTR